MRRSPAELPMEMALVPLPNMVRTRRLLDRFPSRSSDCDIPSPPDPPTPARKLPLVSLVSS